MTAPNTIPEAIFYGAMMIAAAILMSGPSHGKIARALDNIANELRKARRGEKL